MEKLKMKRKKKLKKKSMFCFKINYIVFVFNEQKFQK